MTSRVSAVRRRKPLKGVSGKVLRRARRAVLAIVAIVLLGSQARGADIATPILVYHRFGPVASDGMTVRTAVFESQLDALTRHGYTVVPLRALVAHLRGEGPPLPPRAVVLTVDDGHRSVYTDMLPVLRRHPVPVTLFVYPSAISNATYALTWDELRELRESGLVDVQSHTYWHPNFLEEKRRLTPEAYDRLVDSQLARSKAVLEARLGATVDLVSWPFGIHDEDLRRRAARAGYVAGLALGRRHATVHDPLLALPRYLITDGDQGGRFQALLERRAAGGDAVRAAPAAGYPGIRTTSTRGTVFDLVTGG
jgi:peptidoglycan/xylan/chitin deacetylase (PgdA/CDA1 family)